MNTTEVVRHRDAELLAAAIAARLCVALVDAQAARGTASVVLTGGGMGIASLRALADSPARDSIDWRRLDLWWGDERFLPAGHADRNETQAREALLDKVPLDLARVHAMAASDGVDGDDVDAAASRYATELAAATHTEDHAAVPSFDVCMLGVGPDGHVASLFPEHPGVHNTAPAFAVRNSPKPPPTRISLSFGAIQTARVVWLLAAGEEKAGAVRNALSGAGQVQVPAAGARGRSRTLWLLDDSAASLLPPSLSRLASP